MMTPSVIHFNEEAKHYYEASLEANHSFQLQKEYSRWHISVPSYS